MADRNVMDEKVVRMSFDNAGFEKNVAQSMSTLDKLKAKFDFSWAKKSFDDLSDSANNVNMKGLGTAVEAVGTQFSALETIATGALLRIGEKAVDLAMGKLSVLTSKIKEATTAQIDVGFGKYGEKTTAVQTIMSATGKSIEEVNEQLTKLNWFTDETSYTFTDMVSNIGKFTSAGVELDTAVTAMQGIATWAAISGQNAQAASRAMYNVSQAMGAGVMLKMDWNSLVNANMATKEFKQNLIRAAKDMGKVVGETTNELGQKVYKIETMTGQITSTTVEGIAESLSDKWLTNDIFLKALDYYGGFTDKVYEIYQEFNENAEEFVLTSELIDWVNAFKKGELDLEEVSKRVGLSVEDVTARFEVLASEQLDLGKRAFAAGQEAKTWEDAWGSVTEAVASGWMNTFEIIFGNYEEAKELWTGIANDLWDLFAGGAEARNELLNEWKEDGGRDEFIESIFEFIALLQDAVDLVKQSFTNVFGEIESSQLVEATKKLKSFVSSLRFSQEEMEAEDLSIEGLRKSLEGTLPVFREVGDGYVYDLKTVMSVLKAYEITSEDALDSFEEYSEYFGNVDPEIVKSIIRDMNEGTIATETFFELFTEYDNVQTFLDSLVGVAKNLGDGLLTLGKTGLQIARVIVPVTRKQIFLTAGAFGEWLGEINEVVASGEYLQKWCDKLVSIVSTVREAFLNGFLAIEGRGEILIPDAEKLKELLDKITESVENFALTVKNRIDIAKFGRTVRMALVDARDLLTGIFTVAKGLFDYFSPYIRQFAGILGSDVKVVLTDIYNVVRKVITYLYENETFTKIADKIVDFINNSKTLKAVMDTIVTVGGKLHDLFAGIYNGVKKFIDDNFPTLKDSFPDTMEKISQKIGELDEKVGSVISNFREWIDKSVDLSKVSEDVANALTTVKDLVTDFGAKAKAYYEERWAPIFNSIGGFFVQLGKKYFPDGLLSLKGFFGDFRNNVKQMLKDIAEYATGELWQVIQDTNPRLAKVLSVIGYVVGAIAVAFKKAGTVISGFFGDIPGVAERMGNSIGSAFDKIKGKIHEFLTELTGEEAPLQQLLVILRNAKTLFVIFSITSALKSLGDGIGDFSENIGDAIEKLNFPLFAAGLLMVSAALKTLAESLVVLSGIDDESLAAITGVFAVVAGVVSLLSFVIGLAVKNITTWKQFLGIFAMMATVKTTISALSGTITVFANAIKLLEGIDVNKITEGAKAITIALALIGATVSAIAGIVALVTGGRGKGSKNSLAISLLLLAAGILALAAAIGVIVYAAKKLSQTISWEEFGKGILMIGAATLAIGTLSWVISKIFSKSEGKFAVNMVSFIGAILKITAIAGVIAYVGGALGDGLKGIRETIEKATPELKEILLYLIEELCDLINKASPALCNMVVKVLVDLLDALAVAIDPIANDLYTIIVGALKILFGRLKDWWLTEVMPALRKGGDEFIFAIIGYISSIVLAIGLMAAVGKEKENIGAFIGVMATMLIGFTLFSAVVIAAGYVISQVNGMEEALDVFTGVIAKLGLGLSGVTAAFAIFAFINNKFLTDGEAEKTIKDLGRIFTDMIAAFTVFAGLIGVVSYVAAKTEGMTEAMDTFSNAFLKVFGVVAGAILVFGIIEKLGGSGVITQGAIELAKAVLIIAGVVVLIVAALGVIFDGVGGLIDAGAELLPNLDKGADLFANISAGIAKVVGSAVRAYKEAANPLANDPEAAADALSKMSDKIGPFADWAESLSKSGVVFDPNVIDSFFDTFYVAAWTADRIMTLGKFNALPGTTQRIGNAFADIKTSIYEFDSDGLSKAEIVKSIVNAFGEVVKGLPKEKEYAKLTSLAQEMVISSTYLVAFTKAFKDIEPAYVNKGLLAAQSVEAFAAAMTDMAKNFAMNDSNKSKITYMLKTLASAGLALRGFYEGMHSNAYNTADVKNAVSAVDVMSRINEIAKNIAKQDEIDRLKNFGDAIASLGSNLNAYAANTEIYADDVIARVVGTFDIIRELAAVAKMIPNSSVFTSANEIRPSVANFFVGENDLAEFGLKLIQWGQCVGEYKDMVEYYGFGTDEAKQSIIDSFSIIYELAKAADTIGSEGWSVYSFITGDKGLTGIAAALKSYATSLKEYFTIITEPYYQLVGGKTVQVVKLTGDQFKEIIVSSFGMIEEIAVVVQKYPELGGGLESIAKGFGALRDKLVNNAGDTLNKFNDGIEILNTMFSFMSGLSDRDWDASAVSFGNAMEYIAKTGIKRFTDSLGAAPSLESVRKSVVDILNIVLSYKDSSALQFHLLAENGVSEFNKVLRDETTLSGIQVSMDGVISVLDESMSAFMTDFITYVCRTMDGAIALFNTYFVNFEAVGTDLANRIIWGMRAKEEELFTEVENIISKSLDKTNGFYADFYGSGRYLLDGFALGIDSRLDEVNSAARVLAQAALDTIREELDIHSPAGKTKEQGVFAGLGFADGIINTISSVTGAVTKMTDGVKGTITKNLGVNTSGGFLDKLSGLLTSKLGSSLMNDEDSIVDALKDLAGDALKDAGVGDDFLSSFLGGDNESFLKNVGFDPENFDITSILNFDNTQLEQIVINAGAAADAYYDQQAAMSEAEKAQAECRKEVDDLIASQNYATESTLRYSDAQSSLASSTTSANSAASEAQKTAEEAAKSQEETEEQIQVTRENALELMYKEARAQEDAADAAGKRLGMEEKLVQEQRKNRFISYMNAAGMTKSEQQIAQSYYDAARQYEIEMEEATANNDTERIEKLRDEMSEKTYQFNRYVKYLESMRRDDISDLEKEYIRIQYAKKLGEVSDEVKAQERKLEQEMTAEKELSYYGRIKQQREEQEEANRWFFSMEERGAEKVEKLRKQLLIGNKENYEDLLAFLDSEDAKVQANWKNYDTIQRDFEAWMASGHTASEIRKVEKARKQIKKDFLHRYIKETKAANAFLDSDVAKDWTSVEALVKDYESFKENGYTETQAILEKQQLEVEQYWKDRYSELLRESDKPNEDVVNEFLASAMAKDWSSFETLQRDYLYWKQNSLTYSEFLKIAAEQEEYKRRLIDARADYGDKVYEFIEAEGIADWSSYETLIRDFDEWIDTGKTYTQRMLEESAAQEELTEQTEQTIETAETNTETVKKSTEAQAEANQTTADAVTLTSEFSQILEALGSVAYNTAANLASLDEAIGGIASRIENGMSDLTIRPVIDFGEIQNGIEQVRTLLAESQFPIVLTPESLNVSLIASELVDRGLNELAEIRIFLNEILTEMRVIENVSDPMVNNFYITTPDSEAVVEQVPYVLAEQVERRKAGWGG